MDTAINLLTSNIPDGGRQYQCSYNFLSNVSAQQSTTTIAMMRSLTSATRKDEDNDMFVCALPSDIPDIPNMEGEIYSRYMKDCAYLTFIYLQMRC